VSLICLYRHILLNCDRKTLRFEDSEGHLIGLWITHGTSVLGERKLQHLSSLVSMLFPGEVFEDDSTKEGFGFCPIHMTQYNRYAEKVSLF
jgi:hypothetical protein